jgi:hypothetical protein
MYFDVHVGLKVAVNDDAHGGWLLVFGFDFLFGGFETYILEYRNVL